MTFFSPSLYLTVITWPSTPATVVSTIALVMVLPGCRSHGLRPVGHDTFLRVEKDVDGDRLLAAVGLRHGGDADEFADVDVGQ